jgi:PHD/YefM family antitoxin component YafN of YafNO toxin-antitoxin module
MKQQNKNRKLIINLIKKKKRLRRHKETDYLLSSKKNAKHIREGIKQLNEGKSKKINLKDLWK